MSDKPRRLGAMLESVLGSLFRKPATIRYPFEKFVMPKDFRGQPKFISEKCSGCRLCIRDCPAQAITITKVGEKRFEASLDLGRCVYCAQCAETCPRKAIEISTDFELAQIDRDTLKIVFPNNAPLPAPRAEESTGA
jgi:formate hydrogenlyase subunit 6/NADH:ubiquinone oxidoreductase subunit I